jgi:ERCC4-related helicase
MQPDNPTRPLLQQTAEAWAAAGREAPRDIVAFAGAVCDAARVSRCDQCGAHLEDQRQVICESCQSLPPDFDQDGCDGSDDSAA